MATMTIDQRCTVLALHALKCFRLSEAELREEVERLAEMLQQTVRDAAENLPRKDER